MRIINITLDQRWAFYGMISLCLLVMSIFFFFFWNGLVCLTYVSLKTCLSSLVFYSILFSLPWVRYKPQLFVFFFIIYTSKNLTKKKKNILAKRRALMCPFFCSFYCANACRLSTIFYKLFACQQYFMI